VDAAREPAPLPATRGVAPRAASIEQHANVNQ